MTIPARIDRRSVRRALAAAVLAATSLAGAGVADAATTTRLDFNIAVNPGAEAATGGSGGVVPIPLWSTSSTMTAVAYGASGFPSKSFAGTVNGGKDMFYCGRGTSGSVARQKIQIVGRNALTDAGRLQLKAAIRIGTTADDGDAGQLIVRFLGASGKVLGSASSASVSSTGGAMPRILADGAIPAGTRALRVLVQGTSSSGPDCDVVFDNVSIQLHKVG